ncbi:MAG: hypothetical protein D6698_00845 [Gammaproteobacteria bacterium]|nr:MAG: hypothetical protein D6698_00845 [Gammaproteobacteria bacterium]
MTRKFATTTLFLLLGSLMTAPAFAHSDGDGKGYSHHGKKKWMKRHYKEMEEINGMLRDVMVILRDLNHKPSPAERKQLNNMINRLDEIMEERKRMHKRYMKKHHHGKMDMDHEDHHHGDDDSE